MKTFVLLVLMVMLLPGFASCRKPDPAATAGPQARTQTLRKVDRGGDRITANGGGMQNYAEREIIVKFKAGTTRAAAERIAREQGLELIKTVSTPFVFLFRLPGKGTVPDAVRRLNALSEVEYAEPNYTRQTQ